MRRLTQKTVILFSISFLLPLVVFTAPCSAFIRAVHYFGHSSPLTFWNCLETDHIEPDFQRIKQDGFNTIILAVPWGEFQPEIHPIKYNNRALALLVDIIKIANKVDLDVILRVGYFWDFDPDVHPTPAQRYERIFYDDQVFQAWISFLEKIQQMVGGNANVLFSFITWEDFYNFLDTSQMSPERRLDLAQKSGFQSFLAERYSLEDIKKLYRKDFDSFTAVPLPERKQEAYELLLDYWDWFLVKTLFTSSKTALAKLSMEVRIDYDPIYGADGSVTWHSHDKTYDLPDSEYVTIYYNPSFGQANKGEEISADEAFTGLRRILAEIHNKSPGKKIFIDQLNFIDNTPGFEHNAAIAPDELDMFMGMIVPLLIKYTNGYSLWPYRDYAESVVYNASFEDGLKGWDVQGNAKLVTERGDHRLSLGGGASITQYIPGYRLSACHFGQSTPVTLRIHIASLTEASLRITTDKDHTDYKLVKSSSSARYIEVCLPPFGKEVYLSIQALDGDVIIDDISLYSHVQKISLYDLDDNKSSNLMLIRNFNDALQKNVETRQYLDASQVGTLSGVSEDRWMSPSVTGRFYIPKEFNNDYVFELKLYTPDNWPVEPFIQIKFDSHSFPPVKLEPGLQLIDFTLGMLEVPKEQLVDVEISSWPGVSLGNFYGNTDARDCTAVLLQAGIVNTRRLPDN